MPSKYGKYSIHEYKLLMEKNKRRKKFGNVSSEVDGIKFDSIKEAKFYGQCKMRVAANDLIKFEFHVVFPLDVNGVHICDYEADFVLYHPDGSASVIDIKSDATENLSTFQLKKKLMFAVHGIKIKIIN